MNKEATVFYILRRVHYRDYHDNKVTSVTKSAWLSRWYNYFQCFPASWAAEWAAASRGDRPLITYFVQDVLPNQMAPYMWLLVMKSDPTCISWLVFVRRRRSAFCEVEPEHFSMWVSCLKELTRRQRVKQWFPTSGRDPNQGRWGLM